MKIIQTTKIQEIVNKETIDKILSINTDFKDLGAWTIEKYANSGVDIKDFAKIGKISTNDFLKQVESFGFEVEYTLDKESTEDKESAENSDKVNEENLNIVALDVRPVIASGADPFNEIMEAVKMLKPKETLKIINVFVPIPLVNVLKGKGFKSWTNTIKSDLHHTFFTKADTSAISKKIERKEATIGNFDDKLASYGDKKREIDVRHLEMPEPMITILSELETLPNDHVLVVNHKKVPQFLLPELKTRNYQWMSKDVREGYILFIVFK